MHETNVPEIKKTLILVTSDITSEDNSFLHQTRSLSCKSNEK